MKLSLINPDEPAVRVVVDRVDVVEVTNEVQTHWAVLPRIGPNGHWYINNEDTGITATSGDISQALYEIAQSGGYPGTKQEFINSLGTRWESTNW